MIDKRDVQRTLERFESPEPAFDRLVHRRERRERRKRVEAVVVALAITVATAALVGRSFTKSEPADQTTPPGLQAPTPGIWVVDPVSDSIGLAWGPDWLDRTFDHSGSWIGAPTLSPDGDRIAFVLRRDGSPFQLWTVSSTGQDLRQVTDCSGDFFCPIAAGPGVWQPWSPDGRSIAFSGGRNSRQNPSDIYAVNADGTDMRKLVDMQGEEDIADFSPDGSQIVFDTTSEQIFLASLDGGKPTLLVDHGDSPRWSPDGRWVAFSRRAAGPGGSDEVWLVRPDGTHAHMVTRGVWAVGWSSDGSQLAILQGKVPSGSTEVRTYAIVDVATGEIRTLDVNAVDTAELLFRWPGQG
jgi:Tol biopolymer transport system component